MADIAMCKGIDCPMKDDCYRHTAPEADTYQSWFMEVPIKKKEVDGEIKYECEYFWNNK